MSYTLCLFDYGYSVRIINQLNIIVMRFKNETHAWVMWSMNFCDLRIWMGELWGGTYLYDHFMSKFNGIYERCGSRAVMNTFYCELSDGNAEKLRDWVMDNYAQENWAEIYESLCKKYYPKND